jgi:NAD(P)H-quinone oxidoreductase subunit 5
MDIPSVSFLLRGLALGVPLTFGLGALLTPRAAALRHASLVASAALALALVVVTGGALASLGDESAALGVRLGAVTFVMLLLVCTIALVITRYSRAYLRGDAGAQRYARALLGTLGAVTVLVLSSNLLVIALAWTATSLALHRLLTHHEERVPALVAAHKKFLVSRLADACLLGALGLVASTTGSLELDAIDAYARARVGPLPLPLEVAALLLVAAVCLKSAQLPFHGWLTQVMEAPTPVSALLHAGVVNIGGFLMIRLAPLMALAPAAQWVLVVVGTLTTVVAALVTTTRVSVKVALAWSTCAQMGFMLVECGLGAWHLALLHLVAHSLYKAHAFLASGSVVEGWRVESLVAPRVPPGSRATWLAAAVVLGGLVLGLTFGGAQLGLVSPAEPAGALLVLLLAFSLAPLVARGAASAGTDAAILALRILAVVVIYLGWHEGFGHLVPSPSPGSAAWSAAGLVVVGLGLTVLFACQTALVARPQGRLARALHPGLFAGLYLDELFTRLTFRIWPPRLPPRPASHRPLPIAAAQEA